MGYRTGNKNAVESIEFGFCTVIGTNPGWVTSLGNTVPMTWFSFTNVVERPPKLTRTCVAGVKPAPLTTTVNGLVMLPAIIGDGWPVTLVSVGPEVPTIKLTGAESMKSPDGPRLRTFNCTVPVVTKSDGSTVAVNKVGFVTVVRTCEAANSTTLPVVNLLMFPVKMFPVNVVGAVKLLPCTVI